MSLPVMFVPEDTIKLFSLPKPVKIRPYLVGEEKILLIAQAAQEQSKDNKEVEKAVKQIIGRCTFGQINVDALPSFDVEYLFLQLRSKSVNNIIEAQFRCKNMIPIGHEVEATTFTPTECGTIVPVRINIDDVKLTVPEGHTNKIQLDDKVGVTLKYPTAATYDNFIAKPAEQMAVLEVCLETIFTTKGDVYEVKESQPEEVRAFIDSLTLAHVDKIRNFFKTMPRLAYTFTFVCPKCQYKETVTLQGLSDFFD